MHRHTMTDNVLKYLTGMIGLSVEPLRSDVNQNHQAEEAVAVDRVELVELVAASPAVVVEGSFDCMYEISRLKIKQE